MKRLFALFPSYRKAEKALDLLREYGVGRLRLGVLIRRNLLSQHLTRLNKQADPRQNPGAIPHAAIGTLTGLLAGIGTVTLPDVGIVIAAGELRAHSTDSVSSLLRRLGMSDDRARRYYRALRDGNVILTVRLDGDDGDVRDVIAEEGAEEIAAYETNGDND